MSAALAYAWLAPYEWLGDLPAPVFTSDYERGTVTVDAFQPRALIDAKVLEGGLDVGVLVRRFRTVTITCANARAVYRIVRRWDGLFGLILVEQGATT